MSAPIKSLYIADRHGRDTGLANFRKEDPPILGEKFGPGWASEGKQLWQLPGGGLLLFDLDKLTLQDYRAMRNHYQINISLSVLMFMVHEAPWKLEGGDKKVRDFVEENLREIWARLVRALSAAFWCGYAPTVIQYEQDSSDKKIRITKFKDIEPELARVNWRTELGYAKRGQVRPKIHVYDGIKIWGQQSPVPPENSIWYPLLMESGDYYGRKLLKPAFPAWFFSQIMHLYANRYFERFGEPTPIGRAPLEEEIDRGDGTTITGKQAMENILSSLRNRGSVVLPSDVQPIQAGSGPTNSRHGAYEWQIEYLESQMRGADFERYLSRLDEEMSLGIFTPVLLYRTADVGSYNLGEAHERIFLVMINAIIGDMSEYIQKYVIERLVGYNYGLRVEIPRFKQIFQGEKTQATLRQLIAATINSGQATINVEDMGDIIGMRMEKIEQLTQPAQPFGNPKQQDPNQKPGGQQQNGQGGNANQVAGGQPRPSGTGGRAIPSSKR